MAPVALAFLWHMHQPQYRLPGERVALQPWVRLHAARAYYDMVRVLEEFPGVRVTFNLVATLLEQIDAYRAGGSDLFRETARRPVEDLDDTGRRFLVDNFFAAQETRMIRPLPRFAELHEKRREARRRRGDESAWRDFRPEDLRDLQALFDLAWFGFKAREDYPEIDALRKQGRGYTPKDVATIHRTQDEILAQLPGLYRAAAARGQAEITASPYAHPILPLLCDSDAAKAALLDAPLPQRFRAPGDAQKQVADGIGAVEAAIGVRPRGMWPSEGSISAAAIEILEACGIAWAASDVDVLQASERDGEADPTIPWRLEGPGGGVDLVFRDHDLSDRIGFTYARADPHAAAIEIVEETRARAGGRGGDLRLVALDGENPWEHYPDAGGPFLRSLYAAVQSAPGIAARTVSEAIAGGAPRGRVRRLRPGSWINADFGIWIGGPEKNRAWDLLGETRARLSGPLGDPGRDASERAAAWRSLRAAEGSDWFWWLDGQFESLYRDDFDRLFRAHLESACRALGVAPPDALAWPLASTERGAAALQVVTAPVEPVVDGFENHYLEWYGARPIEWTALAAGSTMQRAKRPIEALRFGITRAGDLAIRIDAGRAAATDAFHDLVVELRAVPAAGDAIETRIALDAHGDCAEAAPSGVRARARKICELLLPAESLGLAAGSAVILFLRLTMAGESVSFRGIELRRDGAPGAGR
ncbi:MAG TPA: glycoside hydrolase family 57 protein [Dongiaceae bacterium]|nr:glycoside hydrolase family 57 protein [Dongiaceae bacterium]